MVESMHMLKLILLQYTLALDTGDLELRVGLHSGPVTGGFLKGKGARFQLFGDTVNTATLLQTTSKSGRIHMSLAVSSLNVICEEQVNGAGCDGLMNPP